MPPRRAAWRYMVSREEEVVRRVERWGGGVVRRLWRKVLGSVFGEGVTNIEGLLGMLG